MQLIVANTNLQPMQASIRQCFTVRVQPIPRLGARRPLELSNCSLTEPYFCALSVTTYVEQITKLVVYLGNNGLNMVDEPNPLSY